MQRHEDNIASRINGNALQPLQGVNVTVTSDDTGLPASLYSDNGVTALAQPLVTDVNGGYGFYAPDGKYTLTFSGSRIATFTRKIILEDPADNPNATLAQLAAPSGASLIGHGEGTVADALEAIPDATQEAVDAHKAELAASSGAALVGTVPAGGLAASTVQGALDELDAEKASLAQLAADGGAARVGFAQAGAGAVARTVQDKARETVSVKDFGADPTGASSSLAAFTAAYNDAVAGSRIHIPAGNYAGVSGVLTGTKFVIWEASGQPNGGGLWNLPGLVEQGYTTRRISSITRTVPDDDNKHSFFREANHTGGTHGYVCANVSVNTSVGAGNTNFEWGFLSILNNSAAAGENVAIYGQGNKLAVGPTWAGVFEARDKTNQADPTAGLLGLEIDVFANGADANNNRIGIDFVVGQGVTGAGNAACEAYAAMRVNRRNAAGDVGDFNYGLVVNSAKVAGITLRETGRMGIDLSEGTFNDGFVANMAIRMAAGQKINFNAELGRSLRYEPATTALRYSTPTATLFEIGDDGSVRASGEIRVVGTKVVGSRDTGWSPMTGVGNKNSAYDTATVTLAQLAGRVASLQAALTLHGLIGA